MAEKEQRRLRYIVGYLPDDRGLDALALARMLSGQPPVADLVVCTVVPQTSAAETGPGASGYHRLITDRVSAAQQEVKSYLGASPAEFVVHLSSSAAGGLIEFAEQNAADLLILGSARYGVMGRYVVGSVGGALQHASGAALAFAPEGFAATGAERLERVSCGFSETEDGAADLHTAVALCRRYEVALRLITFVFPEYPMFQNRVDDRPARDREAERAAEQLSAVAASLPADLHVQTVVARGGNVAQAMAQPDWNRGDVLVLGSARLGPVARVFLGSTSLKLLRVCPVPVIVSPRG